MYKDALILDHISFSFCNDQATFFEEISVVFRPHHLTFISGENGSGKSTFFRLIKGKIQPHEILTGTMTINGNSAYTATHMVDQHVERMIAAEFTVQENLQLAALPSLPGLQTLPKEKKFDTLTEFFSHNLLNMPAKLLSGGQRQILVILMSMQRSCRILLLDEPTAALDRANAHMVMNFLQELAHSFGLVVLIISHDEHLINQYASEHFYMRIDINGKRTLTNTKC